MMKHSEKLPEILECHEKSSPHKLPVWLITYRLMLFTHGGEALCLFLHSKQAMQRTSCYWHNEELHSLFIQTLLLH